MKSGSLFTRLHVADTEVMVKDNVTCAPKDQRTLLFSPSLCLLQRKVQLRRRFIALANALNFLKAAKNQLLKGGRRWRRRGRSAIGLSCS